LPSGQLPMTNRVKSLQRATTNSRLAAGPCASIASVLPRGNSMEQREGVKRPSDLQERLSFRRLREHREVPPPASRRGDVLREVRRLDQAMKAWLNSPGLKPPT
jgi:hypothetical protein